MIPAIEASQQDLALVDLGVEDAVAIGVGIDQQVRRLGDDDFAIDMGHAERRYEVLILREHRNLVSLAGTSRVFEDHDAVAFRTAPLLAAVVDAFSDIHAATFVEIDVGRIGNLRGSRPDRNLETFRYREKLSGNKLRSRIEINWFVFLRTGREDRKLHVGRASFAATDGAAVVDTYLGAEGLCWTREIKGDEGTGMRTDAAGVLLTSNLQRLAVVVLADPARAERLGFLPLEFREVDYRAVRQDDFGLNPV